MFTSQPTKKDGVYLIREYHMCWNCRRWMCLDLEDVLHVKKGIHHYYCHKECKPLKQPLADADIKKLGGKK